MRQNWIASRVEIPKVGKISLFTYKDAGFMQQLKAVQEKAIALGVYFAPPGMLWPFAKDENALTQAFAAIHQYEQLSLKLDVVHPLHYRHDTFYQPWAEIIEEAVLPHNRQFLEKPLVAVWTDNIDHTLRDYIRKYDKLKYSVLSAYEVATTAKPEEGITSFVFPQREANDPLSAQRAFGVLGLEAMEIEVTGTFIEQVLDKFGNVWQHDFDKQCFNRINHRL